MLSPELWASKPSCKKALVTHPHLLCQELGLFLTAFPSPPQHYLDSGPRIEVKQVTTGDCPNGSTELTLDN